jgi:hypothetical protein
MRTPPPPRRRALPQTCSSAAAACSLRPAASTPPSSSTCQPSTLTPRARWPSASAARSLRPASRRSRARGGLCCSTRPRRAAWWALRRASCASVWAATRSRTCRWAAGGWKHVGCGRSAVSAARLPRGTLRRALLSLALRTANPFPATPWPGRAPAPGHRRQPCHPHRPRRHGLGRQAGASRALGRMQAHVRECSRRMRARARALPHGAAAHPPHAQCNALVMSATMAAVSEALALGKRLDLDPEVLTDVLNSGSGQVGRDCLRAAAGARPSSAPGRTRVGQQAGCAHEAHWPAENLPCASSLPPRPCRAGCRPSTTRCPASCATRPRAPATRPASRSTW